MGSFVIMFESSFFMLHCTALGHIKLHIEFSLNCECKTIHDFILEYEGEMRSPS